MKNVLLHGLGQNAHSWQTVSQCLAGESFSPELFSLSVGKKADYASLYAAVCEYIDGFTQPVNLCGLSLGAVLALQYGIEHPQKLRSLVLIAPQYAMPKQLLRLQNFAFRLMPEPAFKETGLLKADMIALCRSMADLDFTAQLKNMRCRTLIICGARDKANKLSAHRLHRLLPCAELKIIARAGHTVNTEVPRTLSCIMNDFFEI